MALASFKQFDKVERRLILAILAIIGGSVAFHQLWTAFK